MIYHKKINSFFEAQLYLSKRFANERTSREIEINRHKKDCTSNYDFTYIEKVAALEHELDERFEITELMAHYFKPLKLKEQREGDPISIGAMLLAPPFMLTEDSSIDRLIEETASKDQVDNITHYYTSSLMPFGLCGDNKYTLTDFMQTTNELLAVPEDKWALVDAAANPVEHLKKLKPLVDAVADFIQERSEQFEPLIKHIEDFFISDEETKAFLLSQFSITDEEFEKMNVFPSLFLFREMIIRIYDYSEYELRFGCYMDVNLRFRRMSFDPETHLSLLKVITDNTRFRVLRELCNQSSYGLELAEKYGITRNAMYYHLEKLAECGLVEVSFEERRMLHTMDKRAVYEKLTALRDYLVDGWKPEDEESKKGE